MNSVHSREYTVVVSLSFAYSPANVVVVIYRGGLSGWWREGVWPKCYVEFSISRHTAEIKRLSQLDPLTIKAGGGPFEINIIQ